MTHFIVPLVVPAALWVRDRARWLAYTCRFVTLSFLGVLTFVVFPAAPPWLAGERGYLPPVRRTVGGGGRRSASTSRPPAGEGPGVGEPRGRGPVPARGLLRPGRRRPVAPGPADRRVRVLVAYLLAMAFALVVSGEHYVADVLLGWAYAALACWVWTRDRTAPRVKTD